MIDAIMIGAAAGSLLIGFILGRLTAPGHGATRDLQKQLEEAQSGHDQLNSAVRMHFAETADKLNRLTEQYRDVHQHMAASAAKLCGDDGAVAFAALAAPRDIEGELALREDGREVQEESGAELTEGPAPSTRSASGNVAPPRDYAPKASPDDPGVLNERFGLDETKAASEDVARPVEEEEVVNAQGSVSTT